MSGEEWRPIPGHPKYEVSSLGRVRSLHSAEPRVLKMHPAGSRLDYLYVSLGGSTQGAVHTFVAAAFLGPRPPGLEVRHLNGDPKNNTPSNLAYGTSSENARDTVLHGTHAETRKTHCKRGHEFTAENTVQRISQRTGWPSRACRTCVRDYNRERMRVLRANLRAQRGVA